MRVIGMNDTTISVQGAITWEEIESFARDWYRKVDEHVPVEEILPMVAPEMEFRIPEGVRRGHDGFRELYQGERGWVRSFFDEVHTVRKVVVSQSGEQAVVEVVVNWQARRWQSPAARSQWIGFDAYQQWVMVRSAVTGRPVILRYIVNELRPMPGSPGL
jgi:hypothetical protein